ncbi:effector-associated domain EAD1-containing protein [Cylindrospermopsis raciborskii]|uniref:effector-associated domain EAD1-containing protein n=2 Tax=Cylindrospermopsis raciborskii TaxID=77022 RepID=UPI0022C6E35A|nr:effector-associated domain EAD1-containing protein [Cylindrospermopsis raciborskii]MCZ2207665.1 effector-associated domain EAD1-containing protein [Cylindrospermopsis raciborskii PAMP2011]
MRLSNSETEKLFEALLDAYRDYDSLRIMVRLKLGETLERFAGRGDLETVVFNLIDSAERRGKLQSLIVGAYEKNPDNPELKRFYKTVFTDFKQRAILDSDTVQSKDFGPDIDWRGKTDEIELERFKNQLDWYDVGFLQRIIEQAKSVCRVDLPDLNITATGVLVAKKYVLTNYHVLKSNDNDDLQVNAKNIRLNFGCFGLDNGQETSSKSFRLNSQKPILAFSPVKELDYVLLQLEDAFTQVLNSEDGLIKPAQHSSIALCESDGINILQHPNGESMKLSISCDGITGVYPNSGLVQYINKTSGGSSGSPCFNENGELVALHHAQRSKYFGTIREGILFTSIYNDLLKKSVKLN